ncbi:TrfA family protein [Verminephrobacter aporrectodeae subsp. tuberculatae]|nr:TrfA family protein [Verminephrobacter aporrectodeae subsp. tuberculatae]MCW8171247.1 TrfA family protein [Verminephrobacter aporrectodeae subsp. tuberculatae]
MKTASDPVGQELSLSNDQGTGQIDKIQRSAYLSSKGIKPTAQLQLDLIFPDTMGDRDDMRHIPNDYARSAIFTISNKREPRRTLMREKLFHYNEHVSILYSGIELRAEDDELVWLQILKYGEGVPLGEPFEFSIKRLVRDVNWSKNGRNYDRARECITRLRANEVLALNKKAYGKSGSISLIQNYTAINDADGKPTQYRVWIDPNLIVLFAGNTFTSHTWELYRDLSPVARRLADYIESHQYPYPLTIEKFRKMCGSNNENTRSWKQTVKKACAEVQEAKIAAFIRIDDNDQICCAREQIAIKPSNDTKDV